MTVALRMDGDTQVCKSDRPSSVYLGDCLDHRLAQPTVGVTIPQAGGPELHKSEGDCLRAIGQLGCICLSLLLTVGVVL